MARTFVVPEDLGTPPGGISLRGATNFQTPSGWDTVYTPIFKHDRTACSPMLIVRVETDWFPHETEFRYVLQPGEGIPGSHQMPIGQVVFVPREEVTFRDCTTEEVAEIMKAKEEFFRKKPRTKSPPRTGCSTVLTIYVRAATRNNNDCRSFGDAHLNCLNLGVRPRNTRFHTRKYPMQIRVFSGIITGMPLDPFKNLILTPDLLRLVGEIDEFKGAWKALGTWRRTGWRHCAGSRQWSPSAHRRESRARD